MLPSECKMHFKLHFTVTIPTTDIFSWHDLCAVLVVLPVAWSWGKQVSIDVHALSSTAWCIYCPAAIGYFIHC